MTLHISTATRRFRRINRPAAMLGATGLWLRAADRLARSNLSAQGPLPVL